MDWRRQIAEAIRSLDGHPALCSTDGHPREYESAIAEFPMSITPYYLGLINQSDPRDPLSRMVVPHPSELNHRPELKNDPIDEASHNPLPGLIRRYPDRALLLVSGQCAVYCRHCTRRQLGKQNLRAISGAALSLALDYIREHEEIRDVIVSGGDPLLLEDDEIGAILSEIRKIPHVDIIRIGTRTPVVLPMRIGQTTAKHLARFHPLYVNTQFNHPREITPEASRAISHLVDAGIPVANQSVLLKGVNDNPATIEALCRGLLKIRVRPYYLFLCDLWPSLEHMRTTLDAGIAILAHLRGRLSGLGIPTLVADLPGGIGKIPLGPEYIVGRKKGATVLRSPDGQQVIYPDPKN